MNLGTCWLIGAPRFWLVTAKIAPLHRRPASWSYPNAWSSSLCTSIVYWIATLFRAALTCRSTIERSTCSPFRRCTSAPVWLISIHDSSLCWNLRRLQPLRILRWCCLRPFVARWTNCATTASIASTMAFTCFCGSDCPLVPNGFTAFSIRIRRPRLTLIERNCSSWTMPVLKRFVFFVYFFFFYFHFLFHFGLLLNNLMIVFWVSGEVHDQSAALDSTASHAFDSGASARQVGICL